MNKLYLKLFAQVLVSILIIAWLSVDFYNSIFHGVTLPLRMSGEILISENPVVFILVVAIKLAVYGFFIHLVYDCYKQFRDSGKNKSK